MVMDTLIERDLSHLSDRQRALLAKRLKGREVAADAAGAPAPTALITDPARRFEPYPLRSFQQDRLALPAAAAAGHRLFLETRRAELDTAKFRLAWQQLHAHYEVMRSRITDGGHQVLPPDTPYDIVVEDLRTLAPAQRLARLGQRRAWFHALGRDHGGQAVQVAVCQLADDDFRCFFSFDLLVMDLPSTEFLALRCRRLYEDRFHDEPRPRLSLRDYRVTEDAYLASGDAAAARSHWARKIARQPERIRSADLGGPQPAPAREGQAPAYLCDTLAAPEWASFQAQARAHQTSEFTALLTLFMDLLARQSGKPAFGLESRTFQRLPMHPHILELLGPFTLGHVVQREPAREPHFAGRCAAAQAQAGRDLLHAHFDAASQWHATEAPAQRGQKIVFTNTCIRFDEFVRNSLVPPLRWLGEFQEVWQVQPDTALEYVLVENDLALENHWFINPDLLPMPLAAALHKQLMEALRALGRDPGLWSAACVFSALGQTLQRELP
jgi:pyochelin synthetase